MCLAHVLILVVMVTITDALDGGCLSPKFRVKPTHDAVAVVGGTHQFRCIVRGRPAPYIKWFSKDKIVSQKKNVMVGKYSLTISNIKKSDEGAYACLATNDHGFVWGNFTLKVVSNKDRIGSPPHFRLAAPKQNVVAFVDGSHKFLCEVKGNPKPNLVWYHKNKMLSSNGDVKIRKYSLKISELKKSDGGAYACKASNIHGVIWGNFTLRVLNNEDLQNILFGFWLTEKDATAPIMEDIKNQTALTGNNVTFTCQLVLSDYQPLVQWLRHFKKNDKGEPYVKIVKSSEFKRANDDPQHLILRNVTKKDEGWYTCLGVNSAGMNSRSAWLTVLNETEFEELKETDKNEFNTIDWYDCQDGVDDKEFDDLKGPPDFTRRSHVRFLTKAVNSSIDFDCAVMAFPVAEINWLKNGIPMKEKTGKYIFNRYTLTVKYLTSEDNGNYTCEVRNEYGAINRTITLEVQKEYGSAPIMEDISNQTVLTGTNVTFSCRIVMSDSQPLLQWLRHFKKNDSYVNEKGEPYVKTLKSSGFKSTIDDPQHLVLQNVTKEDEGWYTCLVANTVGTNYRSAWLTVLNETEFEGLKETDKDEVRTTEWYDYQDEVDDTIFDDIKGPPEFKRRNHVRFLAKAVNSSIDVDCDVLAFPVAEINWLKNGIPMKEKTGKYIFNRYNLTVKYLTREDNGNYTCEVRNEYGSINRTITLEVQKKYGFAPIMEDVRNQTALTGTNVTFSCRIVLSDSQPLLQWLRHIKTNDAFVNEKGEPYVKILQSSGFKSTIDDPQHLVLRNVTKEDEGWYTCLVANDVGMNYRSAWLTVLSETEYEELR